MSRRALRLLIALTLTAGCNGAEVVVRNHSTTPLDDFTIAARGASTAIRRIDAGTDARSSLCPEGEAGSADLTFRVNGQQRRQRIPLYFECDALYRVQFDVSDSLQVTGTASLR